VRRSRSARGRRQGRGRRTNRPRRGRKSRTSPRGFPDRNTDKGKPAARRGRKATGLGCEEAELPKGGTHGNKENIPAAIGSGFVGLGVATGASASVRGGLGHILGFEQDSSDGQDTEAPAPDVTPTDTPATDPTEGENADDQGDTVADDQGENADDQGDQAVCDNADDQGENEADAADDQGESASADDQGEKEAADEQGADENADDQGE